MGIQLNGTSGTDVISAVDGSLTVEGLNISDSIIHLGDTNTKLRFPAADTFTAETGGTERLRIDSNGNLGVGNFASVTNNWAIQALRTSGTTTIGCKNTGGHSTVYVEASNTKTAKLELTEAGTGSYSLQVGNDNALMFFDDSAERLRIDNSGRLLLGTTTNTSPIGWNNKLQVAGTNAEAGVSIRRDSADTGGALLVFGKSRGSLNGNTVVQSGDQIGGMYFAGGDGTDVNSIAAQLSVEVDGTPGSNDMPGRILFKTTADGASSPTERLRITSDGQIKILGQSGSTGFYLSNAYGQAGIFGGMYFNGSSWVRDAAGSRLGAGMYVNTGGFVSFLTAPETSGTSATMSEKVRILNNGHLLIGDVGNDNAFFKAHAADGKADDLYVGQFINAEATAGRNYGVNIQAGSNNTDHGLRVKNHAGTVQFIIQGDGDIGLGMSNPNLSGYSSPVTSLGHNSTNNYSVLELTGNKTSNTGTNAPISTIVGYNVGGASRIAAINFCRYNANNNGAITFETYSSGSATERMLLDNNGKLHVGHGGNSYGSNPRTLNVGRRTGTPNGAFALAGGESIGGGTGPYMEMVHGPDGGTQRIHQMYSYVGNMWITPDNASTFNIGTAPSGQDFMIDTSGNVTKPNNPSFAAYHTNSSWTVSANSTMGFNATRTNVGGHFSTSNHRFTAPVAGHYSFHFFTIITGNYNSAYFRLFKNGSRIIGGDCHFTMNYNSGHWDSRSFSQVLNLAAGDYVTMHNGSPQVTYHGGNWHLFSGYLLG